MTINIIRLLNGYIFIMILSRKLQPSLAAPCMEENDNGIWKANCSGALMTQKDLQNLNPNIQSLDLSKTILDSLLTGNSFAKYKNLKWLSLKNCNVAPGLRAVNSDPNVFKLLENLEELELTGLKQIGFPKYNWPENIRILKICATGLKERLDANDILKLEEVDLSNNEFMTKFPIFNPKAPVSRVVMYNANLEEFTVRDLAPNCHISDLEMSIPEHSPVRQPAHYCDCTLVLNWLLQFAILHHNIQCKKSENQAECENKFDESVLALRRACIGEEIRNPRLILLLCVLFLIALVLITLAFAYRYANLRYHIKPISISKSLDGDGEEGENEGDEEI